MIRYARSGYRTTLRDRARDHGPVRQQVDRDLEKLVRIRALARLRWARWHGWSLPTVAEHLGLSADTLADWQQRWDDLDDRLKTKPLGAPALTATPIQRRDVLDFLTLFGSDMALRQLQDHFPTLARRDLGCLLYLARQQTHSDLRGSFYRSITWNQPGSVWAMDHTEPPQHIDGIYRYVLTVRDLATGATLAAHAVEHPDARSTIDLLKDLVARHRTPLVIKVDNGSAFIAAETIAYLDSIGTVMLRSPPYTPQYNGACEAGNGTIKRLAHDSAVRNDRPDQWTLDDLEAARLRANRRITDPTQIHTPEQRFAARPNITDRDRTDLRTAIAAARTRRLADLAVAPGQPTRTMNADALQRHAISEALMGLGYYTIRCRNIRPCNPLRGVV